MTRSGVLSGLVVAVLMGCASLPDSTDPAQGIAATGRVIVTGSAPHVLLVLETDRGGYELVGDHAAELWSLQGRQITVRGRVVREARGPGFPARLEVNDFEISQESES